MRCEIRQRNLPRALLYGVGLVTALYLLVNAAYLYVLPIEAMKNSSLVAADAMTRVAGHSAASIISALVMLSTFGAVAATAIADPRVFYSMAREGLFFQAPRQGASRAARHRTLRCWSQA